MTNTQGKSASAAVKDILLSNPDGLREVIMFGKKVGGFARRAEEIVSGELAAAPEIRTIVETMMKARRTAPGLPEAAWFEFTLRWPVLPT